MENKGSLPYQQQLASGIYSEPDESIPYPQTLVKV
jgi:hypothetical protein